MGRNALNSRHPGPGLALTNTLCSLYSFRTHSLVILELSAKSSFWQGFEFERSSRIGASARSVEGDNLQGKEIHEDRSA
jgi:hypothetical protein